MPLYRYICPKCGEQKSRVCSATESIKAPGCPKCGTPMKRNPKPPTTNVVERLDNGFMTKALERPADAQRLYAERSRKDPLKDD